jgi:hypothetical protein
VDDRYYDPLGHAYYVDGRLWPSVTQALGCAGHIDRTWYTPESAVRGRLVHHVTAMLHDGPVPVDPAIAGYVQAYQRFLTETGAVMLAIETALWGHDGFRTAGQCDRVAQLHQRIGILDIKSGDPADWHPLQLAAYARMYADALGVPIAGLHRWTLHVRADGTYRLRGWPFDPVHEAKFNWALHQTWQRWDAA